MEYVIWGIPPGQSDEQPLHTKSPTRAAAEKMIKQLAADHGCTAMRIQELDMSGDGRDVQKMFRKSVRRI